METSEQYLEKIKNSDLSSKTKQAIVVLVGDQVLTQELKDQAKAIIAAEIEEETKGMFVEEDDMDMSAGVPSGFIEEGEAKEAETEDTEPEEM